MSRAWVGVVLMTGLALAGLGACTILAPGEMRDLGFLSLGDDGEDVTLELPDTVEAGVPFVVRFGTFGLNTCYSAGETEVEMEGDHATVWPYDYRREDPDVLCGGAIVTLPHEATLTFGVAGIGTVEVRGRALQGRVMISVTDTVVVR